MTRVKVQLGSVSSGTMRTEDLISAFMDALDVIREEISLPGPTTETTEETEARKAEAQKIDFLLGGIEDMMTVAEDEGRDYYETEGSEFDLEELIETLNYYAPLYCYFGAHEGDGADYGFWVLWGSIEEDCHSGDLIRLKAGTEWPVDEIRDRTEAGCTPSGVLYVNDHGNASLWAATEQQPDEAIWEVA